MISLHNHPQRSFFSSPDMSVVVHDGTKYFSNMGAGVRLTQEEIVDDFRRYVIILNINI